MSIWVYIFGFVITYVKLYSLQKRDSVDRKVSFLANLGCLFLSAIWPITWFGTFIYQ